MEFKIEMEKPSNITRKFTVRVPAQVVANRFQRGLVEIQKTANLKGFRPGQAPISMIQKHFGEDVRHRVYHSLIDESYREALKENQVRAVGSPKIESPEHKTGEGAHDHAISEDKEFTYTATVEVLPEIDVKGYTGVSLTKTKIEVKDEEVSKILENIRNSQAELIPAAGGLVGADGKQSSRPVRTSDHVDLNFAGGLVTESGLDERPGMKGSRVLEIGSNTMIPGFEDEVVGMRSGETKTFRVRFPKDYHDKDFNDKEAEFTVTVNEVKEKKLPELNDELAKQMGYENVQDLQVKIREHLLKDETEQVEGKLRSDLIQAIIEKNAFEVPVSLIEAQTRALAQDWAGELKRQGVDDATIQQAVGKELENIRKRAEGQVRASLLLESIAQKEKIEVSEKDFEEELEKSAGSMQVEPQKLREFYAKDPGRKEDFMFRMRQDRVVKFLLDAAKIKVKS